MNSADSSPHIRAADHAESRPPLDFDKILRNTQARVRAYIAGLGVPSHEVDDVAQDVYLEFYKNIDKTPPDVAPERWLKGIARNLCMNHFRKKSRRTRLHQQALVELLSQAESSLETNLAPSSAQVALEACYNRLPGRSRKLLSLRYMEDLSSASIAEAMESTSEAIRVSLHRIRNGLKNCIEETLSRDRWR